MSTTIVRIRQSGTRSIDVHREFSVEVPEHISHDSKRIAEWIEESGLNDEATFDWTSGCDPLIHPGKISILGPAENADIPMTPQQRDFYNTNEFVFELPF